MKLKATKIGKKLTVVIDRKVYSINTTPEVFTEVKILIESFNVKNNDTIKKKIIKLMTPVTSLKKAAITSKIKETSKRNKTSKKSNEKKLKLVDEVKSRLESGEKSSEEDLNIMEKLLKNARGITEVDPTIRLSGESHEQYRLRMERLNIPRDKWRI